MRFFEVVAKERYLFFEELGIDSHRSQRKAHSAVDSIVLAEGIDCANIVAGLDQLEYVLFDSDYLGTLTLLLVDEPQELCSKDEFEEAFSRQDEANCFTRFLHFVAGGNALVAWAVAL